MIKKLPVCSGEGGRYYIAKLRIGCMQGGMENGFKEKLNHAWESSDSVVCVGLDPKMEKLPEVVRAEDQPFFTFNKAIVDATSEWACAYKPQFAYYAGAGKLDELKLTIDYIKSQHPEKVVILDSKRGDIGSTATEYALESFDVYGADAVTVNPYMGGDTLEPFTAYKDKGVIVLCKTSNPGSSELQNLVLESGETLFMRVAKQARDVWNKHDNICLVVGATYPEELAAIREVSGEMPLLIPGIGAQGGDLEATLRAGVTANGKGVLLNSSRGIIFASKDADYAEAAGAAAQKMCLESRSLITSILEERI